jgi:hypothetical protein
LIRGINWISRDAAGRFEDTGHERFAMGEDRYEQFKGKMAADKEYREAYAALAVSDPAAALKLPHPDASDTDPAKALELLRGLRGGLKADPAVDLRT